uniref:PAP-associated domain-containing protein n=1 Tax=Meloidogyne incognita TaxID=6306 RepID=A0A914M1U1_MELIC
MDEYTVNELFKVKTSPNAHKIFKILDDRKNDYRHSFKKYTKSVQDYIVKNRQPDHERKTRIDVWKLLRKTIEPFFGEGSYLAMGGSTLTNLATKGADLDLCFAIRCEDGSYTEEGVNNFVLSKIHRILEQKPFITGLRHICARVPIVTVELAFPYMDVKVDINCNCVAGIFNTHLLAHLSRLDNRFVQMNMILKKWAKVNHVVDPSVNNFVLSKIHRILEQKPFITGLRHICARVPIVTVELAFPYMDVKVDINCNCVAGIFNTHLLSHLSRRKFNSYTVSLMIIHFLQCGVYPPILPNLFKLFPKHFDGTGNVEDLDYAMELDLPRWVGRGMGDLWGRSGVEKMETFFGEWGIKNSLDVREFKEFVRRKKTFCPTLICSSFLPGREIPKNERTIGELIYGFFDYYTRFNYDEWGISIKDGKIFDRNILPDTEREYMFFIEEAYDGMTVPKNLKRQSNLMEIVGEFKQARLSILKDICENYPPPIDETEDYRDEFEEENNNKILKRNNNEINNLADNW